jgi:NAD(P)-dependent dehydrogenase (short-subunit alcohol dehydrogenase family)
MVTALVTGANRGMGLEFCRQLAARGDRVIATCRRPSPELQALEVRIVEGIDMTSDEAIARLAGTLAGEPIDWLVLNAGIMQRMSLGELDFAALRHELDVDALGPLRVVQALLPNLGRGARIALITSRMGSIADNSSGGYYGYRMAKAALNMAGVSLARDLAERGIAVIMLHPGMVHTDLLYGGAGSAARTPPRAGVVTPDVAVRDMLLRIDALTLETSGRFVHRDGSVLPW